ncbi:Hypothetical protein NTJ_04749 [Nesidiocoris tenuis]|uniref:Uncharacterized protein n=1 Tax=Nesidiocoris tenuis TaxID=355587 RepID=A0ABN7AI63_9HEMI|nr:Hypothetical protein NTJ_04749 [Nesidiocoris tenuis]
MLPKKTSSMRGCWKGFPKEREPKSLLKRKSWMTTCDGDKHLSFSPDPGSDASDAKIHHLTPRLLLWYKLSTPQHCHGTASRCFRRARMRHQTSFTM